MLQQATMMTADDLKRLAVRAAIAELPESGVIGLGTGSTVRFFLEALRDLIQTGRSFVGVPTSEATRAQATALGIPLLDDAGPWTIAVTFDGADEVDPALDLIKGAGGALLREKIVNAASARNVILIDETKLSPQLGTLRSIPLEVVEFGHRTTAAHLARHGHPVLREDAGSPVRTDAGHLTVDLDVGPIADVRALDRALRGIPGVVDTGLFVGRADLVIVGAQSGICRLVR
jgi:ribose 5-phosphate isomerase A